MATCAHCRGRKGKRECPALRGGICSACCGEHRLVEIPCPSDCRYLQSHETYQRRRTLDKVPPAWIARIMGYERKGEASQVAVHEVQMTLCRYDADKGRLDLLTTKEGLEFARRQMSLLEAPETYVPAFGEFLVKALDELIKKKSLVDREGIRQVLDEFQRHLEAQVTGESFPEFLKILRALYADQIGPSGARPSAEPKLVLPG